MKKALIAIMVLALIGLIDASYLAYMSYAELPLPCSILHGCNEVAASPYSKVFGIPLSLYGAVFYGIILMTTIVHYIRERRFTLLGLRLFAAVGFLSSAYFIYLQAFVIKAFCIYCLLSATVATLILVTVFFVRKRPAEFASPN
ncbi:vitamin K epoxide reductase family protein [Candidatus Parcubacteria bacterium]|nr:vitamin K epoxide reductase family protein [Candidatus Parcubacteria bacterium]